MLELLIVISVIGVLVSLLLSVYNSATVKSKQVSCASNLREIGAAMQLYAGDNNGYFPPGYGADNQVYGMKLLPYVSYKNLGDNKRNVFICPGCSLPIAAAADGSKALITYSVHGRLCQDTTNGDQRYKFSNVTHPSQTILAVDAPQMPYNANLSNATIYSPYEEFGAASTTDLTQPIPTYTDVDQSYGGGGIRYRHNGAANAVMVDGHVQVFPKGTVTYQNGNVDR